MKKLSSEKSGDNIESVSVHDFKTCFCGDCSVDSSQNHLGRCAISLTILILISYIGNGL